MRAECQCGRLSVDLAGRTPALVVACHCVDCQRRSGSPFGVLAYYPADQLATNGEAKRFERPAASGGAVETFFCPECGSTVYVKVSGHPTLLGIAVGAIADPSFQAPHISVWEQSMHRWVTIPGDRHFTQNAQD